MTASSQPTRSGGRPYAIVWSPIPLISWLMPFIGHMGICSSSGRTYDFAGPFTVNEDCLLFGKPTRYLTLGPQAAKQAAAHSSGARSAATTANPPHSSCCCTEDPEAAAGRPQAAAAQPADLSAVSATCREGEVGVGAARLEASAGATRSASTAAAAAISPHSWDHRLAFAATTYRLMQYNLMTCNCHCFVAHFLNQIAFRGGGWDMVNLAALVFLRGRYTSLGGLLHTWLPWVVLVALGGYFGRLIFLAIYLALCVPLLAWFLVYTWCCWRDLSP
ncbi:hypothetical protein Agub_g11614 [Astrephomene gubernaculifera]|uniref:Uncharacterized protein n=1 Tax=Astrephomene gubernaculifera TaxID=47775 RepID=A0AAD3HQX8_9CHLO|nr:hypothetical protein Agub_g11614 [Astrephomene gubernaculifera]